MFNRKLFPDRQKAGQELAELLIKYKGEEVVVLSLPRGGVPIGFEIAKALGAPLDIIVSRKLTLPGNREFGIGAISEGNSIFLNPRNLSFFKLSKENLQLMVKKESTEIQRQVKLYRQNKPLPDLKNKIVIITDDGLATGVTAKAAVKAIKPLQPRKIIFASPVCGLNSRGDLSRFVDEVVCVISPARLHSVGLWYEDFPQLSDKEVVDILADSVSLNQIGFFYF